MERGMNGLVAPAVVVVGLGGVTAVAWVGVRHRHRRHPETLVERVLRRMEPPSTDRGSPVIRPGATDQSGDDAA